jgi:hypothetical protein
MLSYFKGPDAWAVLGLLVLLAAAWLFPRLGSNWFARLEKAASRFARRKRLAILVLMLAAPAFRLCLLPILPVPVPAIHDEFSYLLAADTFAHGRLTNPPHPMWNYFETIHVNQQPTYMSKYPPAQGMILAVGQLLGHPWIGVLLSVSLMCGAALWMLQGWLPPRWALLGAVLVFLRLSIFSYWMNSYWGGALTAVGGALVAGALPRIFRKVRVRDAALMGIGAAILANSRPYEGFLFCLPIAVYLLAWLARKGSSTWRITLPKFLLPLGLVLAATVAFMGYYNWRNTGDPLVMPYMVNEARYDSAPLFFWQKLRPPIPQTNPQLDDFYNRWLRDYWTRTRFAADRRAAKFVYFYLWPELCIPILALPWILKDRRVRFLIVLVAFCFMGDLVVVWFEPHYAAALLAPLYALVVQGMRHMRRWRVRVDGRGLALARAIVVFMVAVNISYAARAFPNPHSESFVAPKGVWGSSGNWERARIKAKLEALPGPQLVIVRVLPGFTGGEWVYNRAEIDRAKVVWARETPEQDLGPLLRYFKGRQVWLLKLTSTGPELVPFPVNSGQN